MDEFIFDKKLKTQPNLRDYEAALNGFNWKNHHPELEWFGDKLNAAHNAVDRHARTWRKNKVALYWEGDEKSKELTFLDLAHASNKFANLLSSINVRKGDRVFIFLPRVPELYTSFLGIMKTGAIAGTMFSAFGPVGIKDRLENSSAKVLVTNRELCKRVDEVRSELPELKNIVIIDDKAIKDDEVCYEEEMKKSPRDFEIEKTSPDDYSFMLFTSGTTGKPKGVVHRHYSILQEHMTAKWVLDLKDEDILWCTADPGWVTGIAYGILGSWSNGASSVVFEGRFDAEKWYSILEKYNVSVWYTAPTAIRMLMAAGDGLPKKFDLSALRHLCSVGEPLNPEAVRWSVKALGIPFHDNWWQTETGGILIANYPCMPIKPGSMGKSLPGITAGIVDDSGNELKANEEGNLAIRPGWPSMMGEIWKNPEKYNSYFVNGWYMSGDRAYKDVDGYFWFVGRSDDIIKTSGERVGPFEIESVLIEHPAIVEAGVIGKPDAVRGEIVKAFVVLRKGFLPSDALKQDLQDFVKKRLAGHAYPREIDFIGSLPKTRSGKIVRRVLKAKELGLPIGDTSMLEEF